MATLHYCSDGSRVSEATIQRKYSASLKEKHEGRSVAMCEGCGMQANDNSHIISKARCKHLHKADLIWNTENYFDACRKCHMIWEEYKSGEFVHLQNLEQIMIFLKEHDHEGFTKRMLVLEEVHG